MVERESGAGRWQRLKNRCKNVFKRQSITMQTNLRAPYFLAGQAAASTGSIRMLEMPVIESPIHVPRQSIELKDGVLKGELQGQGELEVQIAGKTVFSTNASTWSINASEGTLCLLAKSGSFLEETDIQITSNSAHITKQIIRPEKNRSIELFEIYGQPPSNASSTESISMNQRECVACLTRSRDTVVLPCRHMCLCETCADSLRSRSDQCPVCRQNFSGFLHLGSSASIETTTSK